MRVGGGGVGCWWSWGGGVKGGGEMMGEIERD